MKLEDFDFSAPPRKQLTKQERKRVTKGTAAKNKENDDDPLSIDSTPREHGTGALCDTREVQDTEDNIFTFGDMEKNVNMKKDGERKRLRSLRRPSERGLKDTDRVKRPRKRSASKQEVNIKQKKYNKRMNARNRNKESGAELMNDLRLPVPSDSKKIDDPIDWRETEVTSSEKTQDQSFCTLQQPTDTEQEEIARDSHQDNRDLEPIPRSQVDKRKTSPYFSKKALSEGLC